MAVAHLYGLFWASQLPGDVLPSLPELVPRVPSLIFPVPLAVRARAEPPPVIEAMILYPALLTPEVRVRPDGGGAASFEVLLLGPAEPVFNAQLVNRHLKIAPEMESAKWASSRPLFANPQGHLEVQKIRSGVDDAGDEILEAHQGFRGIVDQRFWDALRTWEKERAKQEGEAARARKRPVRPLPKLDTIYRVQVELSCVVGSDGAPGSGVGPTRAEVERIFKETGRPPPGVWLVREPQDLMIASLLLRKNGEGLRGEEGRGLRCFQINEAPPVGKVLLSAADRRQPIQSYHPLFVYPPQGLGHARFGHVSDLHVNGRQQLLALSPARVIDLDLQGKAGAAATSVEGVSRPVGDLVNVYADNVLTILRGFEQAQADVLLVGGDLIDHVSNAYPYNQDHPGLDLSKPSAATVWGLVDLGDGLSANYRDFHDYVTFYSIVRHACVELKKPMYVVSGNHDAYHRPYGVSPRLPFNTSSFKANPGIPADHNLTFYEAILVFGETYGEVWPTKSISLHKEIFEWFYGVLTPFRDYAVDLGAQRLVGLGWGDDEGKMVSSGHGLGHLPRATQAVGEKQRALLEKALGQGKPAVLFTHFTFVSYTDELPNQVGGNAVQPGRVNVSPGKGYTMQDLGTFEGGREELYAAVAQGAQNIQCVLTGHSHRKGLYFLRQRDRKEKQVVVAAHGMATVATDVDDGYLTEMHSMREPLDAKSPALAANQGKTAIVVSDSGGPLPRLNDHRELEEWGSDRPAGTLVETSAAGVTAVRPVRADGSRAVPRLAVAIDYLQVMKGAILTSIATGQYDLSRPFAEWDHRIFLTMGPGFPSASIKLARMALYHKLGKDDPWSSVALGPPHPEASTQENLMRLSLPVARQDNGRLRAWLALKGSPRFLSLAFEPTKDPVVVKGYDWGAGGVWSLEADCKLSGMLSVHWEIEPRFEIPDFEIRRTYFADRYG